MQRLQERLAAEASRRAHCVSGSSLIFWRSTQIARAVRRVPGRQMGKTALAWSLSGPGMWSDTKVSMCKRACQCPRKLVVRCTRTFHTVGAPNCTDGLTPRLPFALSDISGAEADITCAFLSRLPVFFGLATSHYPHGERRNRNEKARASASIAMVS